MTGEDLYLYLCPAKTLGTYDPKCVVPTVNFGQNNRMASTGISYSWVQMMFPCQEMMISKTHNAMLEQVRETSLDKILNESIPEDVIFQEDNAQFNRSRGSTSSFERKCISVMKWSRQDPDLNAIDNLSSE